MMRFAGSSNNALFGFADNSPQFSALSGVGLQARNLQKNAASVADAKAAMTDINANALIESAGFEADAIKAQGQAEGQASLASGIAGGIGTLAGGFGGLGGSVGGMSTALPKLGTPIPAGPVSYGGLPHSF